jgi:hypothetical protein
MTLAQLCCTSWALAACAELGVQGPESVLADQLNFPAVSCIVMFPASRKRCEKVVIFGAQNPIYPEMSSCLTASFILRKGILLLLPICVWIGYSIVEIWIYLVLSENYLFLLWYYSSSRKAVRKCKRRYDLDISSFERELFLSFV